MEAERDYVLGTTDEEIARLGLQHRVWRPRMLDAWRRAGFTVGQTILDAGCGPGYATLDLADIVGPAGAVVAVDRSQRFLDALSMAASARRLSNVRVHELDLDEAAIPMAAVDGAWCRWVLAFVKRPRAALARIAGTVRTGGAIVLHEYFDYATWRLAPRSAAIEEFVGAVIRSWRERGGEPDVALEIPRWLEEFGFDIRALTPIVDVVRPSNYVWQWPATFLETNLERLVELGHLAPERAEAIRSAFRAACAADAWMITPAVLEVIAVRR